MQNYRNTGNRATLLRVARAAGVSVASVSNAYNRPEKVSDELRQSVFEAAKQLGYTGPNPLARGLRSGRVGAIGWMVSNPLSLTIAASDVQPFLHGVESELENALSSLLVLMAPLDKPFDESIIRDAIVDGFIVHAMSEANPAVQLALDRGLPVVIMEQPIVSGVPTVIVDHELGAKEAGKHLADLGHRHIGILSSDAEPTRLEGATSLLAPIGDVPARKFNGYLQGLTDGGVNPDDILIYRCRSTFKAGYRGADWLLSQNPKPTAILAMSDDRAFGAMAAAREQGLDVPRDLSVIGHDDVPSAELHSPALTTVHQPIEEKGRLVARMLLGGMDEQEVVLPTHLVIRGTTARPK